jgi:hypothetical protein
MNELRIITAAMVDWSSQLYAPAVSALGAESVLSLSAQSTTDRVLDLATEIAIIAASLFVVLTLVLGIWSTLTSPKTAIGRLLNNFRIDHLYLDVGLVLRTGQGKTGDYPVSKSFLRSLSLRDASVVTSQSTGDDVPPVPGQLAELALPGLPSPIKGRILRAVPVPGLKGSFNLDLAFDELAANDRASLANFIRELRHPARA